MDAQSARRIIECLRSGVSSRESASVLTVGREPLMSKIEGQLKAVRHGRLSEHLVVEGAYGQGKTHILNKIEALALGQNFAVSRLVASRESPLGKVNTFYQRLVCNLVLPDRPNDRGVKVLLDKVRVNRRSGYDAWMTWVQRQGYQRLENLLQSFYEVGTDDPEPFYEEMEGTPVPATYLKHSLKIPVGTPRLLQSDYWGYLRAVSDAIHRFGYDGWVILIDEAELVQGLGLVQRVKAYETLARLWGLVPGQELPQSYVALSFARSFYTFMLERNEGGRVEQSLRGKGLDQQWEIVSTILDRLEDEREELDYLSEGDYQRLLDEVTRIYRVAYGHETPVDRERLLRQATGEALPIRTLVRSAIQYLDIALQYPGEDPLALIDVGKPDEGAAIVESEFDGGTAAGT